MDDLAEAQLLALEHVRPNEERIYNLGTGRGYSVQEVIRTCEEVSGRPVPVHVGPRRLGDPPILVASPERAKRELGWQPRWTDLRAIVETAWQWHSRHPCGYDTFNEADAQHIARQRAEDFLTASPAEVP